MTETFVKTVKLRLCDPLRDDKQKIEESMRQSVEIANEASKRMPSFPFKYIKNPRAKGSPLYGIVQDLRNSGITLNAARAFEAVEKARESYLSMRQNRDYDGIPKFKNSFVRLHNRYNIGEFFYSSELTSNMVKDMMEKYGESKTNDRGWGLLTWSIAERYLEEIL